MLPFTNFTNSFNNFDQYSAQFCPQYDFSNVYMPFTNYGYYSHQDPYFSHNTPFNQFPLTTLLQKTQLQSSTLSHVGTILQIQNQRINKNDSSDTIQEKIIPQQKNNVKTKFINKKRGLKNNQQVILASKVKKVCNQSKYNESQYSVDQDNKKKSEEQLHLYLKYRRKNTESNIVNRIYSFLTSQFKNKKEVLRLGLKEEKKQTYLKYLNQVIDAWKGPVKRQLLRNLINVNESLPGFKSLTKIYQVEKVLSLKQFSYLNRILIRTYLSKIAGVSVITSKKMKKCVWKQHLQKIRELKEYFFQLEGSESKQVDTP